MASGTSRGVQEDTRRMLALKVSSLFKYQFSQPQGS